MILDRVIATLHSAAPELSATEVAESLWLARFLNGPVSAAPPAPARPVPEAAIRAPAPQPPAPAERTRPPSGPDRRRVAEEGPSASLYLSASADQRLFGLHTRAPAVQALPHALELLRAMRPLRRRIDSSSERELDEEATAQASAIAGRLVLRYRQSPARWLDLALVVDDSPSMVVWRRTAAELGTLLERLGAFRSIRTWSIDTGMAGADPRPVLRPGLPPVGKAAERIARHPRELLAPSGRRVLLIFSDCVGPAWHSGELLSWLEDWGAAMPTALIQPLPIRLWDRCALDVARVRLRAYRPGAPNDELRFALRDPQMRPRGIPVPVMEAEPR